MERALRQQVRRAERVVEVAVREEQVGDAGELAGAETGVERDPGRLQPEPGLLAGDGVPLDCELPVPEDGRSAGPRPAGNRQISW